MPAWQSLPGPPASASAQRPTGHYPLQRARLIDLIRELGRRGKTVIVSSHILYEVERFADRILVINRGKLAAAGDFHAIRDRIDEHARAVRLRCSDPRRLAAALVQTPIVLSVRFEPPAGFTHADVLFEAHLIRTERKDYNIAEIHLADAIERLVARRTRSLSDDRGPKDPY